MRRPSRRLTLAVVAVLAFLMASGVLARVLAVEGQERDAVMEVLREQARGDADGVLRLLEDCGGPCAATVRASTARLAGPGEPKVVRLDSGTAYALGDARGTARVVWVRGVGGTPVVQCAVVHRKGSVLTDRSTSLLRLSAPLRDNEAPC